MLFEEFESLNGLKLKQAITNHSNHSNHLELIF